MSPEAVTTDRIYRELRQAIMTGRMRPGGVVVTAQIAERLGTSVTPVRDALHQLAGERLVAVQSGGGFLVPALEEAQLRYLYQWHGEVTAIIIRHAPQPEAIDALPELRVGAAGARDIAWAAAGFFEQLALQSANPEHAVVVDSLAARLHYARSHEQVLGRCRSELRSLWDNVLSGNKQKIRTALWHYHRRRLLNVGKILAEMTRSDLSADRLR